MAECRMLITTVSGKTYTTDAAELTDEEVEQAYELFRNISTLKYLTLEIDGESVVFNPKNVETMSIRPEVSE